MATSPSSDHQLTAKDFPTVFHELYDARAKWNNAGLQLGMSYGDLTAIKQRHRDDPDECFKDLLSRWLNQAEPKPTWEAMINALESQTVGCGQLAETIKGKYCLIPVHTQNNTIQPAINGQQTCSDSYFHCPCGLCDLISYLDNGCPKTGSKQYPYLELSNLDEDDKEDLIQKLSEDTANIIQSFADLLSTTGQSLNRKMVKVDELAKVALDLGAFKSDKNQLPLLGKDRHKLLQAKSVDSALITLGEHMSFFNYEILSHIINYLGSEKDKENLAKYCIEFETFCERKVFEVPPRVFDPSRHKTKDQKSFVVLGTEDLFQTLNDVKAAQRKIASLLGLRVSTLRLKQIDVASVILVFSVPASVWHFLQLDSLVFKSLSSIGLTLLVPDLLTDQADLNVDNKDTVDQTSSLSLDEVDRISMLSLDSVDQKSVLSLEADQVSLLSQGEVDRLSMLSLGTVDQRSVLSFGLVSNDSGFYSRSSSQMTLNSLGTPLPIARSSHPTNTVSTIKTNNNYSKMAHSNRGARPGAHYSPAGAPRHHTTSYLPSQHGHTVVPITTPFNATNPSRGFTNQMSRPDPPSTLHMHGQLSPTSSHGTPSPLAVPMQKGLTRADQLEKLATSFRKKNKKIGVFYDSKQKQKADSIVRRLNDLLSGGVCIVQGFEILPLTSDWLQRALLGGIDYFIFVGLPPSLTSGNIPRSQPPGQTITETAFFDVWRYVQRVAEVVVVLTEQRESRYSRTPHYLDKFLRLESDNMEKVAEDALALFAAPRPKPFEADKAYFSEVPKLITIPKRGKSLGFSIMTREMSRDSEFPRIVLIKSFGSECVEDVKSKLGTHTHIQSYNGVFLDGMDIKDIIAIFQSMRSPTAQLLVRYIHPIRSPTHSQYRTNTPIYKPEAPRLDPLMGDELPIPLYILGDIHTHCKKLFELLKEEATSPVSDSSSSSVAAGATTPTSEVSTQISFTDEQSVVDRNSQEEGADDAITPLGTVNKGLKRRSRSMLHYGILSEPDEALNRAMTSSQNFDGIDSVLSSLSLERSTSFSNGGGHPSGILQQPIIAPPKRKKHYILQLPQKNLNRHFTHIFFRRSGIFLITVGLVEMMGDPLIQFENLCYWLRQVRTYVGPENVKRIIIVGVHDTLPGDIARLNKIDLFIWKLNQAIHENKFKQIMELSRERTTLPFNLSAPEESIKELCRCINKCMKMMIEWAWYFEREFFMSTFQPFVQLGSVLSKVASISSVVVSWQDLEGCYIYEDKNYKKTLANYSQACINPEGEFHLLHPTFLIELLSSMEMNSHNYIIHATSIPALRKLPIVSAPFPKQQMETIIATKKEFRQLVPDEKEAILEWAEKLELIYSLGKSGEHMLYFVPFLATEALGDQANFDWDYEEAERLQAKDITVLYAKIHIPASYQFFYGLIAELLKDVLMEHDVLKYRCCVNLGCKEAILPLHYLDDKLHHRVFRVYLQYHPLQNIIEFRAKIVKQQLAFLKTVENKLKGALGNSKSFSGCGEKFNTAVTFALPATEDSRLTDSALWVLGEPVRYTRPDGELDDEDFDEPDDLRETELLKTRIMTPEAQREWASSAPEMKEIPPSLFLEWSKKLSGNGDKWALLGGKLGLMTLDDINFYRNNPNKGGNGEVILRMWKDSDCSYTDLVAALRDEDIRLDKLASQIESYFSAVK